MAGITEFNLLLEHGELLDALELVYHSRYQDVCRIWNQPNMSDSLWANYTMLGVENLQEQQQLNHALLKLRTSIQELINHAHKLNQNKENSK